MAIRTPLILYIFLQIALVNHTFTVASPTYLDSICSNNMVFAANSKYQTNLNSVFLNLTLKAAATTYGTITYNNVFGLFLCRGDLSLTSCKECVVAATRDLSRPYCPMKKAGVIWYTECMVRYSNESFFGKIEDSPKVIILTSRKITGNQSQFTEILDNTLHDLIVSTSNDKNTFYTKVVQITGLQTLEVFSQCTLDLKGNDCTRCLKIAVSQLPISITGRVLQPSCNVWYEVYKSEISSTPPSSNSKLNNYPNGKKNLLTVVMIATLVPVASVLIAALALYLINKRARNYKTDVRNVSEVDVERVGMESLQYDLPTLQSATNNFSNLLGQACTYGKVYKGILPNGVEIAVKRVSSSHPNFERANFINEAMSLAKLQHRNLQKLLGFCMDGEEKFLVFEYMPYNLTHFLLAPKNKRLGWESRIQIIKGVAKGMLYLHQDSRLTIVHRDLKGDKILLDNDMNPKIADFSIAMILQGNQPEEVSPAGKSSGYVCPEYFNEGRLTVQSDVFSFGILVLEIISGTTCMEFSKNNPEINFITYAREEWEKGRITEFVDEAIRDSNSIKEFERCIHLGLVCAEDRADKRPTMATVVLMLESHPVTLPMPKQPASMSYENSIQGETDQSVTRMLISCSVDDDSITEIEPR